MDFRWGDKEAAQLARVLHSTAKLKQLSLADNKIGDEGYRAIARALAEGAAPSLKDMVINSSPSGKEELEKARPSLNVKSF